MANTVNIGCYFVAFIYVVGQRDRLRQWVKLPSNDVDKENVARILLDTSEYIKDLREQFNTLFEAATKPTGLLDHLKPEQLAWVERRKKTILWRRGFSDSYFMTVPCWYEASWGSHSLAIYSSLFSVANQRNGTLFRPNTLT